MTWNWTYRPQNLKVYVVFDEETNCLDPRMQFLSLDQVLGKSTLLELDIHFLIRYLLTVDGEKFPQEGFWS